jgi:hypothetical protein
VTVRAPLQQDAGTTPAASTAVCGEAPANAAGDITVHALRESFPQWRIFWQDGQWWALRGGPVRLDGPESLLLRCITAAGLTGLAEKLCLQERLDRLDPLELAAVYDGKTLPRASRVSASSRADPGS